MLLFLIPKLNFYYGKPSLKPKLTIKSFILGQTNVEPSDKDLLDCLKKSIEEFRIAHYFLYFVLPAFLIFNEIIILCAITDEKFLELGIEWLKSPFKATLAYPREIDCVIKDYKNYENEDEGLTFRMTKCELKLNCIYESIFLILWFWIVFLIGFTTICLTQQMILLASKSNRLERARDLLPSISEPVLIRLAYSDSFFILEILSAKLNDSTRFQKLMQTLIDENYQFAKSDTVDQV